MQLPAAGEAEQATAVMTRLIQPAPEGCSNQLGLAGGCGKHIHGARLNKKKQQAVPKDLAQIASRAALKQKVWHRHSRNCYEKESVLAVLERASKSNKQVVDDGPTRLEVAMRVLHRIGNVDIYVGLVSDQPETPLRSGVRRVVEGAR